MNSDLAIAMAILMLVGVAAQAQPNGASPRELEGLRARRGIPFQDS